MDEEKETLTDDSIISDKQDDPLSKIIVHEEWDVLIAKVQRLQKELICSLHDADDLRDDLKSRMKAILEGDHYICSECGSALKKE